MAWNELLLTEVPGLQPAEKDALLVLGHRDSHDLKALSMLVLPLNRIIEPEPGHASQRSGSSGYSRQHPTGDLRKMAGAGEASIARAKDFFGGMHLGLHSLQTFTAAWETDDIAPSAIGLLQAAAWARKQFRRVGERSARVGDRRTRLLCAP